jgi:hypothetical protein
LFQDDQQSQQTETDRNAGEGKIKKKPSSWWTHPNSLTTDFNDKAKSLKENNSKESMDGAGQWEE